MGVLTLEIVVYSRHQFRHPTVCWARKMSDPLHTPCILLEWIILLNGSGKPHTPLYLTTPGNHLRPGVLGPGVGVRIPLPFPSAGPCAGPVQRGPFSSQWPSHFHQQSGLCWTRAWEPPPVYKESFSKLLPAQQEFWCQLLRKGNLFILVIMNMGIIIHNDTQGVCKVLYSAFSDFKHHAFFLFPHNLENHRRSNIISIPVSVP